MNDNERSLWVMNDENLHKWYRRSQLRLRAFVRRFKVDLDAYINAALNKEPTP